MRSAGPAIRRGRGLRRQCSKYRRQFRPFLQSYKSKAMRRKYTVKTNGLIGTCEYTASDPDDAAVCAKRHENYLRLLKLVLQL